MLAQVTRQLVREVTRTGTRSAGLYKGPPEHYKPVTMDEMPVPEGSWQEDYNRKQRSYNLHLFIGVSVLVFTIGFAKVTGAIYLNAYPPSLEKKM